MNLRLLYVPGRQLLSQGFLNEGLAVYDIWSYTVISAVMNTNDRG